MGHIIAVAGKGGGGKTTLCGLMIQYLCEHGKKPVLAVDADANSNLNEVLGVEVGATLGELREEIERAGMDDRYQIPSGMTKQAWLEIRMADAIVEEDDFDFMVMGRTQGRDAIVLSMVWCRHRFRSSRAITLTWWWTMRQAWSMSAEACSLP